MSLLTASGVSVKIGQSTILRDMDFTLQAGEIVTIVGPNGSGKSTFLRSLIGAQTLAAGKITRQKGLRIGYVPQKVHVDATLPMTALRFMSLPTPVAKAKALATLERVGAAHCADITLADLSGGQLQRVLLARALLNEPHVLVLDEATQGLDQPGAAAFYRLIEDVRETTGCAVLMVSHDLHVVMAASDRVLCINGHICCEGAPESVASAPAYRALFGSGTQGALALYRHQHTHSHDQDHEGHDHSHDHDHPHEPA